MNDYRKGKNMKIIFRGKRSLPKIKFCKNCFTIFTYNELDISVKHVLAGDPYEKYIECPNCGKYYFLERSIINELLYLCR